MTSLAERISYLQGRPEELAKYMRKAHYGPDEEGAVRQLMTPGSEMANRFASDRTEFNRPEDVKRFVQGLNAPSTQQTENFASRIGAEGTQTGLDNPYAAGQGQARQIYADFLDRTKTQGVEGLLKRTLYDVTPGNGPEYVEGELKARLAGARRGRHRLCGRESERVDSLPGTPD